MKSYHRIQKITLRKVVGQTFDIPYMSGTPIDKSGLTVDAINGAALVSSRNQILAIKMIYTVETRKINCIWLQTCSIQWVALLI